MTLEKWWNDFRQFFPGFRQNVRDGYWLLAAWFAVSIGLILMDSNQQIEGPHTPLSRLGGWLLAQTPMPRGVVVTEECVEWVEGLRVEDAERVRDEVLTRS